MFSIAHKESFITITFEKLFVLILRFDLEGSNFDQAQDLSDSKNADLFDGERAGGSVEHEVSFRGAAQEINELVHLDGAENDGCSSCFRPLFSATPLGNLFSAVSTPISCNSLHSMFQHFSISAKFAHFVLASNSNFAEV